MLDAAERELRQRQLMLRLRSAELRAALCEDVQALQGPLGWADRGWSLWMGLRRGLAGRAGGGGWWPRLGALALGLLALRRPSRTLRWLSAGLAWWRLGRRLIDLLRRPR
ncbi:MAG: hypothetical protein ACK4S6_09595 [Roseateles asaccharophilus]|uniref:YqjK-like protein n=1 Tax=Roseateles asaccharophilus TaxID=582607 RepID=A0A4R6MTD7_9BURK|nr:hypothetical protein [Roseateles asaccharophilus]MDN3546408.1 hypothetical protein [Roseateles asaccharophilus]TDP04561.1 hypothetical protein DFR39_11450 [Roseateles asaccharophilus]